MKRLVLSLFPGIGLLDMAFEEAGFCVVRGPDLLWGGDVRRFHPPAGRFDGVIGGPPCQAHTGYANINRHRGNAVAECLISEYTRIVSAAVPRWFLMENVAQVPDVAIEGYAVDRVLLNARWLGSEQNRERVFQFGSVTGAKLRVVTLPLEPVRVESACLASEGKSGRIQNTRNGEEQRSIYHPRRDWDKFCELQGLPAGFLEDAPFTLKDKYRVVGNGVPLPMGRAVAAAVLDAMGGG